MIQQLLGLVLLLSPLLLAYGFSDRRLGYAYGMSFLIASQLFIALSSQALGVFTYQVAVVLSLVVLFAVLAWTGLGRIISGIRQDLSRPDWVLVYVLVVCFFCLYSVHYDYSGKISLATTADYKEVEHMSYPYPYYSDEWYSVAFIKQSIGTHNLPVKMPLFDRDATIPTFEFVFHSFLSEIFLITGLDPLTKYSLLAVFAGLLICVTAYVFLLYEGVGRLPAAIASLSILYLTNGANLPGIWYLTPGILGISSLLLGFFFVSGNKMLMASLMGAVTLLFYPPLAPFYFLAFFSRLLASRKASGKKLLYALYIIIIALLVAAFISLPYLPAGVSLSGYLDYIMSSRIIYSSYIANAIPEYLPWLIVPVPVLLFAAAGVVSSLRKRTWLVLVLFLGLAYWLLYSSVTYRFIIEYERVVVLTGILTAVFSGFGLRSIVDLIRKKMKNGLFLDASLALILFGFLLLAPAYTTLNNWQSLRLLDLETGGFYMPAAPANNYLQPDDLLLFKDLRKQHFLSLPWKGTVLGVATDNFPASTKPGTVSINPTLFDDFMASDCQEKYWISSYQWIRYVYSPPFSCPNYELVGVSGEGLRLYRFTGFFEITRNASF